MLFVGRATRRWAVARDIVELGRDETRLEDWRQCAKDPAL